MASSFDEGTGSRRIGRERSYRLLEEDVELASVLSPEERATAVREIVTPVLQVPRGMWNDIAGWDDVVSLKRSGIGLLILDGLLLRRVGIDGRYGVELLGEGDVLRPWLTSGVGSSIETTASWRAVAATRIAVVDDAATAAISRYPALVVEIVGRALRRSRNLALNVAIVHHTRVDVRLEMILWAIADRWGKVSPEGVRVPLRLTHEVLAELVAARRPTVSSTVSELARRGRVRSTSDGWLLCGEPPAELSALTDALAPGDG